MDIRKHSKILIIMHYNIGDVLHNMAILKPLRKVFQNSHISILSSPHGCEILKDNPYIDEMFKYEKNKNICKRKLSLIKDLRKRKISLVINLKQGSYLSCFLNAKENWYINKHDKSLVVKRNSHVIDSYLNILRKNNIKFLEEDVDLRVYYSKTEAQQATDILYSYAFNEQKPFIVFAPFSNWHAKEWDFKSYGQLAEKLSKKLNYQIILVGGDSDKKKVEKFGSYTQYFINVVGKTNLKHLAAIYDQASLVVGIDSGPFHLATNMNTPALGIFGPTPYLRYRPYFQNENFITCQKNLGCNPCQPSKNSFMVCKVWNRTTPCMGSVSFQEVYTKVEQILLTNTYQKQ